jgi:hypothetical protein
VKFVRLPNHPPFNEGAGLTDVTRSSKNTAPSLGLPKACAPTHWARYSSGNHSSL